MKKFSKYIVGIIVMVFSLFFTSFGNVFFNNAHADTNTTFRVAFNLNGGNINGSTTPIEYVTNEDGRLVDAGGELVTELPVPVYNNYVFDGWVTADSSNTPVSATTIFTQDTELIAWWSTKVYKYEISSYVDNSTTYYNVIGLARSGNYYDVAADLTSVTAALEAVTLDTNTESQTTVDFKTIELTQDETIELSLKDIIIKGSISSNFNSPVFNINPQILNSTITFSEFTISNGESDVLISTETSAYNSTIQIFNTSFLSANQKDYAIAFDSANYTVKLVGNNSHTTKYLFNYYEGLTIDATEKLTNDISAPICVEIKYYHDGLNLTSNLYAEDTYSNNNRIIFENESVAYNVVNAPIASPSGKSSINAEIRVNISFDTNTGAWANAYTLPNFPYSATTLFPVANNLNKDYFTFDAWFGKLEFTDAQKTALGLASTTYYYDTEILKAFKLTGYDTTKIDTLFKTAITDFDSNNAFTKYSYDEHATDVNYLIFEMAETLQIAPEFIARWTAINYTISFDENGGSPVEPIVKPFGETIIAPETSKPGYVFVGWFENHQTNSTYTFQTMPATNFTLYARWQIGSFTVNFVSDGTTVATVTQEYQSNIAKPEPTKTGHNIAGWFTDEAFTQEFDFKTPETNTTVYIKWQKNKYKVHFEKKPAGKEEISVINTVATYNYLDVVERPEDPVAEGHEFINWFTDEYSQTVVTFPFTVEHEVHIYARWRIKQFTITFNSNGGSQIDQTKYNYYSQISAPTTPYRKGFVFEGWFADSEFKNPYMFTDESRMPASDFTLYAKWTEKSEIFLTHDKQSYVVDNLKNYTLNTSLKGFAIEYKVDGTWVKNTPTEVGVYDIRITRAEDSVYAEYVYELEGGYEITPKTLDISWIHILLFAIFVLEIIGLILIKHLQKTKRSPITTFAWILPIGIITTKQLVIAIVLASLVVLTFILIVYELVKLHRISTEEINEPSIYNTRNTIEKMEDKSEDSKIAISVDKLLQKEGLVESEPEPGTEQNDDNI